MIILNKFFFCFIFKNKHNFEKIINIFISINIFLKFKFINMLEKLEKF